PFVPAPTPRQPTPPPQHGTQRPATRNAPSTRHATPQQPPTPTPPRHGAQHPITRRLTATPTPHHRRPATPLQRDTQRLSNHRPPRHPDTARNTPPPADSPPRQHPVTANPPRRPNAARNTPPTRHAATTRQPLPRHNPGPAWPCRHRHWLPL
ncbi:hypothetical protein EDB89DRAFT_2247095, partial [Lactarius sanguifluus]